MIKQDYLIRMIQEIISLIVNAILNKKKFRKDEWTEYDGDDTAHQFDDLTPEELEEKMEELRKKLFGNKKANYIKFK